MPANVLVNCTCMHAHVCKIHIWFRSDRYQKWYWTSNIEQRECITGILLHSAPHTPLPLSLPLSSSLLLVEAVAVTVVTQRPGRLKSTARNTSRLNREMTRWTFRWYIYMYITSQSCVQHHVVLRFSTYKIIQIVLRRDDEAIVTCIKYIAKV